MGTTKQYVRPSVLHAFVGYLSDEISSAFNLKFKPFRVLSDLYKEMRTRADV